LAKNKKSEAAAKRDPEGVRQNILRVASEVFAESGLSGARVDEIASKTKTSKRMVYYYFNDKDGLYQKCLEAAYAKVRDGEEDLDLAGLPPDQALSKLVAFTFEHHRRNPEFIRMVMIENIHQANYLSQSEVIRDMNVSAIDKLAAIIERGQEAGMFRPNIDPVELHWHISALSFFNVSNRPTFSALFGDAMFTDNGQDALRHHMADMILCFVRNRESTPT
jgi:AcrR family transcriptional regulator